jgi:hypothetical protein
MGNTLVYQKHHTKHIHEQPTLVSTQQPTYNSIKIPDPVTTQQPTDEQNKILTGIEVSRRLLIGWEQTNGKWDHEIKEITNMELSCNDRINMISELQKKLKQEDATESGMQKSTPVYNQRRQLSAILGAAMKYNQEMLTSTNRSLPTNNIHHSPSDSNTNLCGAHHCLVTPTK